MISILQSVNDVTKVLQAAYNTLRPGGILIFADRVFDSRWDGYRAQQAEHATVHAPHPLPPRPCERSSLTVRVLSAVACMQPFWDVGHPCAVKQVVIDHFLSAFEEVHSTSYTKEMGAGGGKGKRERVQPPSQRDEQIYFIGRKPRTA